MGDEFVEFLKRNKLDNHTHHIGKFSEEKKCYVSYRDSKPNCHHCKTMRAIWEACKNE